MAPGAFDAISARIIERSGFDAVYVTGAGLANSSLGVPDLGLVSQTELAEHVNRIVDVVDLPLIVDADTGFGGVLNVGRTVRTLERAGVAAIQIEDQIFPKRCGHFDGTTVIPVAEMVPKVRAAVDARSDSDLMLIIRTDARRTEGLNAAIDRANAYIEAGADAIFVEAPQSRQELGMLPSRIGVPLVANMVEGGRTPLCNGAELEAMGFRIAVFANTALRAAMKAVSNAMAALKQTRGSESILADLIEWDVRQQLVGLPEMEALENKLLAMPHRPVGRPPGEGGEPHAHTNVRTDGER
jgi:2-methylisocitrate lyase-like PEP mutase family enzyme